MLSGKAGPPRTVAVRGTSVGRKKGWTGLGSGAHVAYQVAGQGAAAKELVVGRVLKNTPAEQTIEVQPCKGVWRRTKVCHLPLYVGTEGEATTAAPPMATIMRATVRYSALVLKVELLSGGELMHSDARTLSDRGWGLKIEEGDQVAHFEACKQALEWLETDGDVLLQPEPEVSTALCSVGRPSRRGLHASAR